MDLSPPLRLLRRTVMGTVPVVQFSPSGLMMPSSNSLLRCFSENLFSSTVSEVMGLEPPPTAGFLAELQRRLGWLR